MITRHEQFEIEKVMAEIDDDPQNPERMSSCQTILLAEDNPDDVLLAQIAFERTGLTPRLVVVSNGEEAIRYLQGEAPYTDRSRFPFPDLLLLDMEMPKLTGFEVLSWLRRWPGVNHLPVVILADTSCHNALARCLDLGADSFIDKPTDTFNLTVAFKKLADRWLFEHDPTIPSAVPVSPGRVP